MKQIMDEISAKESIKKECKILKQPAELYKTMKNIEKLLRSDPGVIKPKEKRDLEKMVNALEEIIPGNIQ